MGESAERPTDIGDLRADAAIASGSKSAFSRTKRFRDWDRSFKRVLEKHGKENVDRVHGSKFAEKSAEDAVKRLVENAVKR
eukprot:gene24780-11695_t